MKNFVRIAISLFLFLTVSVIIAKTSGVLEEAYIDQQLTALGEMTGGGFFLGCIISFLLAIDLFLPIPSSVLMIASGAAAGFYWGTILNFVGAMISALLGFWLCRKFGQSVFERLTGKQDVKKVEVFFENYGVWGILLSRSVPMFTEIISCLAGLSHMSFRRFAFFSALGTLPVSLVYAYAGSLGGDNLAGWGLPVLVAFVIPAVGYAIFRFFNRPKSS